MARSMTDIKNEVEGVVYDALAKKHIDMANEVKVLPKRKRAKAAKELGDTVYNDLRRMIFGI